MRSAIFTFVAIVILGVVAVFVAMPDKTPEPTATVSRTPQVSFNLADFVVANDASYGTHRLQTYDITYNVKTSTPLPLAVIVHGGGWIGGDKKPFMAAFSPFFKEQGFAAMSINYRLAPDYRYPVAVEDTACAIASAVARATEYNIDPSRIFILGHSAGSHLGALVTYTPERAWCASGAKFRIAGFVGLSGVYDFDLLPKDRELEGLTQFLGRTYKSGEWDEAEPINAASAGDPPSLFIHGDRDTFVNYQQSIAMDAALARTGASSALMIVKGYDHNAPYNKFRASPDIQSRIAQFLEKNF